MAVERQVVSIYAGTKGYLDEIPTEKVQAYERELLAYIEAKHPAVFEEIKTTKVIGKETEEKLVKALTTFSKAFGKGEVAEEPEEKPVEEKPKKKKKKKAE